MARRKPNISVSMFIISYNAICYIHANKGNVGINKINETYPYIPQALEMCTGYSLSDCVDTIRELMSINPNINVSEIQRLLFEKECLTDDQCVILK